ncbi:MAG: 2-hydroxychromene-2-carboxylate isomerase [Myxococcota bacterium]
MSEVLEFWFEFGSSYSYPAAFRVARLVDEEDLRVVWRPFLLGPIFRAQGLGDSPFNAIPAKGRYMWRDLERICSELGLPFRRPSVFPRNGLLAARVATAHAEAPWLPQLVVDVYRANFAEDREISDPDVLRELLTRRDLDAGSALERAEDPGTKAELRTHTERAQQLGIFGAPTFRVGNEIFWGGDRLDTALRWLRRATT